MSRSSAASCFFSIILYYPYFLLLCIIIATLVLISIYVLLMDWTEFIVFYCKLTSSKGQVRNDLFLILEIFFLFLYFFSAACFAHLESNIFVKQRLVFGRGGTLWSVCAQSWVNRGADRPAAAAKGRRCSARHRGAPRRVAACSHNKSYN